MKVEAPKLVSFQKSSKSNKLIASAQIPGDVHSAMLKMAELQGYESMSAFIADAIVEKIELGARALLGSVQTKHSKYKAFDPAVDF